MKFAVIFLVVAGLVYLARKLKKSERRLVTGWAMRWVVPVLAALLATAAALYLSLNPILKVV